MMRKIKLAITEENKEYNIGLRNKDTKIGEQKQKSWGDIANKEQRNNQKNVYKKKQ